MRWMSREEQSATNYNTDGFTYCLSHLITNIWFNPDECGFDLTHTRTSCILRLVTVLVPTPPDATRRHNARPETNFNAAGAFKLGLYFQHQSFFVPMFVCFLSLPWSLTGLPISRVIGCRKTLQQPLQPFDPDAILCIKTSWAVSAGCSWSFAFWWNWKGSCKLETGPGTGRLNICPTDNIKQFYLFQVTQRNIVESSMIKWIISHIV